LRRELTTPRRHRQRSVVADRPVARGIAERCGVRHESPQAILFEAGRPVWHASHDAITLGALHAAFAPRC